MIGRIIVLWVLWGAAVVLAAPGDYAESIKSLSEAPTQVGKYSHPGGRFMRSACVLAELRRILGQQYGAYEDHLKLSGCGRLEREGDYVVADISQLHVGGWNSLIYMNAVDGRMYLFWLRGSVLSHDWELYGDRPVPSAVLASIEARMNCGWGHVASFKFFGEFLIVKKKEAIREPPAAP